MADPKDDDVRRGAAIYSKPALMFYDLFVLRLSNSLAWRCPSRTMLAQYDRCLGVRHLDVGPGTGWYLANAQPPERAEITLMDLNTNSLESASARLSGVPNCSVVRKLVGNVLEPLSANVGGPFDSIGVNYLMHCVPGSWNDKGVAFRHLADRLADDGVLFGSTILGRGVEHNLLGRRLMALYNRSGVFHNRDDDAAGLESALGNAFDRVDVDTVGTVAMFSAREPRR